MELNDAVKKLIALQAITQIIKECAGEVCSCPPYFYNEPEYKRLLPGIYGNWERAVFIVTATTINPDWKKEFYPSEGPTIEDLDKSEGPIPYDHPDIVYAISRVTGQTPRTVLVAFQRLNDEGKDQDFGSIEFNTQVAQIKDRVLARLARHILDKNL